MPHTPEPWIIAFDDGTFACIRGTSDYRTWIADVVKSKAVIDIDREYVRIPAEGEAQANAELLVRAPRLLLLLRQCCFFTPTQDAMARCAMPSAENFARTLADYANELHDELKKGGVL